SPAKKNTTYASQNASVCARRWVCACSPWCSGPAGASPPGAGVALRPPRWPCTARRISAGNGRGNSMSSPSCADGSPTSADGTGEGAPSSSTDMAASSAPRVRRWNGDVSAGDGPAFGAPAWPAAPQPLCCPAMSTVDLDSPRGALREVPFMGVIYVVHEAMQLGYQNGHPDWSNLGQGQPEVGPMRGAPPRFDSVTIEPQDHAYGPL